VVLAPHRFVVLTPSLFLLGSAIVDGMTMSPVRTSIFDAIGGAPAVEAATKILYDRLLADPLLARHFVGVDIRQLKSHMRAFLAAALGGADLYRGRDMRSAHAPLNITEADWDVTVAHLVASKTTFFWVVNSVNSNRE
jgi:hemoglobin